MKDYETEDKAKKAGARQQAKIMLKQCPVYKKQCIAKECMAFQPYRVYSQQRYDSVEQKSYLVWKFYDAGCTSPLVTGYIEMEPNV